MDHPQNATPHDTLLSTTIAGIAAASAEAFLTYPLEYIKTRHQLFRHTAGSTFIAPIPSKIYYKGCSAVVLGNSTKALLRYSIYNQATKFMMDSDGETSAPQIVVAGMFTGLCESLIVVPFESIKTTMIERSIVQEGSEKHVNPEPLKTRQGGSPATTDGNTNRRIRPAAPKNDPALNATKGKLFPIDPNVNGLSANIRDMYTSRGLRSFVQGIGPTVMRQVANSMVRFTSYNFMKQAFVKPNEPVSSTISMGLGFLSGAIQVITTQPIDVVKTRMQSINGLPLYRSSLLCCYRIFVEEGPSKLWIGTLPRLIKASFSGAIVFSIYEATNKLVSHGMKENPFASE